MRLYRFRSDWRVTGTVPEVMAVLDDVDSMPRWWPAVYLSASRLTDGDTAGIGRRVGLRTTGWLPYTLRWVSTLTEPVTERGFAFIAEGDMTGTGRWTFEQDGQDVVLTFDWQISADKPMLRRFRWLLSGVFAANHRWAMKQGAESLRLELHRRAHPAAASVPRPPQPTFAALVRR